MYLCIYTHSDIVAQIWSKNTTFQEKLLLHIDNNPQKITTSNTSLNICEISYWQHSEKWLCH